MTEPAVPAVAPDRGSTKRIVLCLGAHRSGTSLVTAAIESCGAELSLPHRFASAENTKGFFEHTSIVTLDRDLLGLMGSTWDDPTFDSIELAALPAQTLDKLRSAALAVIGSQFSAFDLSALKDPRLCRLLPFWLPLLEAAGYSRQNIRVIIVTRDPVDVAISQRTRCRNNPDHFEFGKELAEGAALWLSHIRQALRDRGDCPTMVISYGDFLERPRQLMEILAGFLDSQPDAAAIDVFASNFVDGSLWRSHGEPTDAAGIDASFPGLLQAERALSALSGTVLESTALEPILTSLFRPAYSAAIDTIVKRSFRRLSGLRRIERGEALALIRDREAKLNAITASPLVLGQSSSDETVQRQQRHADQLAEKDAEIDRVRNFAGDLQRALLATRASRSWRVTRPLRIAAEIARRIARRVRAGRHSPNA